MRRGAIKNRMMFFNSSIAAMVAVFIFSIIFFSAPAAHAYAVGSVPVGASAGTAGTYNIGGSFQNLISPFTGFINNLKWNNNMPINPSGMSTGMNGTSFTWPTVNLTPVLESTIQNTLSQWLTQFDNWFYRVTGVQLSGILVAILGIFSWVLGLAQQMVNWLLGLFHYH